MWVSASLLPRCCVLSKITIASENASAWLRLTPYLGHGCACHCINGIGFPRRSFWIDRPCVTLGPPRIADSLPHHEVLDRLSCLHCRRSCAGRCLRTMRWPGMERRDDLCLWIHVHVLQPVLLPVSSGQRGDYAVDFDHQAQLDICVPAKRDDVERSLCDRLQVPWRG